MADSSNSTDTKNSTATFGDKGERGGVAMVVTGCDTIATSSAGPESSASSDVQNKRVPDGDSLAESAPKSPRMTETGPHLRHGAGQSSSTVPPASSTENPFGNLGISSMLQDAMRSPPVHRATAVETVDRSSLKDRKSTR